MKKLLCLMMAVLLACSFTACRDNKPSQYQDFADNYTDRLPDNAEDGLTLHAFNWTYNQIRENLENIANAGFKNVLTMPVQQPGGLSISR